MKRKLVNKKVVNSIGIGIMAFITASTPVMSVAAQEGDPAQGDNNGGVTGEQTPGPAEQKAEPSEATKAVQDARDAIGNAQGETSKADAMEESKKEGIGGNLEEAGSKLDGINKSIADLNEKNQAASDAKDELEKIVTDDPNGTMGTMAENVTDAKGESESAAESTGEKAEEAEGLADAAETAQGITYENSEAAAAAKAEAQAAADAAEKALEEAEVADAAAQEKVDIAKTSLEVLKDQKEKADAACQDAQKKVQAAQDQLKAILNGEESQAAVDAAAEALGIAQEELEAAKAAKTDTENALNEWEAKVVEAQAAAKSATEELEKKEQEYQTAAKKVSELNEELNGKNNEKAELDGKKPDFEEKAENAYKAVTNAQTEADAAQTAADSAQSAAKTAQEKANEAQEKANEAQTAADEAENAASEAQKAAERAQNIANAYKNAKKQQEVTDDLLSAWEKASLLERKNAWSEYSASADKLAENRINCMLVEAGAEDVWFGNWVKNEKDNNGVEVTYKIGDVEYKEYYDYKDDTKGNLSVVKKTPLYKSEGNYKGFTFPLEVAVDEGEVTYKLNNQKFREGDVQVSDNGNTMSVTLPMEIKTYTYGAIKDTYTLIAVTIYDETQYYDEKGNIKKVTLDKEGMPQFVDDVIRANVTLKSIENSKNTISFNNTKKFDGKGTDVSNLSRDDILGSVETKKEVAAQAKITAETKVEEAETAKANAVTKAEEAKTAKQTAEDKEREAVAAQEHLENAKTTAEEAARKKEEADNNLAQLNGQLSALEAAIKELQGKIDGVGLSDKKDAADKASITKKEKDDYVKTQEAKRNTAKDEADAAQKRAEDADKVNTSVKEAYEKVDAAIKALKNLIAEEDVNTAEYEKVVAAYNKAVSEYEDALEAKGISTSNLARVSAAAERARAAADAVFAYNTPSTGGDGGTTGGGTTGGGGGGTTGGGTTGGGTETPAAPTVTLPEDAVPLVGAEMTTPAAARRTTGVATVTDDTGAGTDRTSVGAGGETGGELTTLEDEETPLAALEEEKETGTVVVEDEETPLAGPVEEQSKMSWWWLLLIAVLGVTGEEMYRRHRKKVAEAEEMNS